MPIREQNKHHDFEWEFEKQNSEQTDFVMPLRYHQTDEFGPTVSIMNEDNEIMLSMPAPMFTEVAEELRRVQGVAPSVPFMHKPPGYRGQDAPNEPRMPVVNSAQGMFKTGETETETEETPVGFKDLFEGDIEQPAGGFESFSRPQESPEQKAEIAAQRGTNKEEWMARRAAGGQEASKKAVRPRHAPE